MSCPCGPPPVFGILLLGMILMLVLLYGCR